MLCASNKQTYKNIFEDNYSSGQYRICFLFILVKYHASLLAKKRLEYRVLPLLLFQLLLFPRVVPVGTHVPCEMVSLSERFSTDQTPERGLGGTIACNSAAAAATPRGTENGQNDHYLTLENLQPNTYI